MSSLLAFVLASLLVIQIPGPSLLFTIGRAISVGRRSALLTVVGNALGLFGQSIAVAIGLGAIVAASAAAFTAVKLIGAGYVIWLGVQTIRHRHEVIFAEVSGSRGDGFASVRAGILVGVTNPKTLVFFASFLPQFAGPAPTAIDLIELGAIFCVLAAISDSIYAVLASRARDWFASEPQRLGRLSAAGGTMMIGLGVTLATVERS